MKIGDKIVCVNLESDNPNIVENLKLSFTIGKTYVVRFDISFKHCSNVIMIVDNLGKTRVANSNHFILLEDWRDKQIDKLGI
jgi:hypothetical protein